MISSGADVLSADGQAFSLLKAFENTNVGQSLFYGAISWFNLCGWNRIKAKNSSKRRDMTLWIGAKSMFGAILILSLCMDNWRSH